MSTNGTIRFIDKRGRELLCIYTHYDSYYRGVGKVIYDFFSDKKNYGNGFEDTVLLFVCYIKEGKPYSIYATDKDDVQEYNYTIQETDEGLRFSVTREDKFINGIMRYKYSLILGTINQFKRLIEK